MKVKLDPEGFFKGVDSDGMEGSIEYYETGNYRGWVKSVNGKEIVYRDDLDKGRVARVGENEIVYRKDERGEPVVGEIRTQDDEIEITLVDVMDF